ncbi:NifB/NifX family molybdenum-iron cluster-binding protein [Halapricum desulfuricans]|nr:NifB/NifX family molybdenum-iron cluster-binding protein [Halapricum desulfuricans]
MQVCMPTLGEGGLDADVSHHFGRAPTYTVYDTDADEVAVYENDSDHRGGSGSPPEIVVDLGADALVCVHLGERASEQFHEMGIPIYCGAEGTVEDALERFRNDDLTRERPGSDACREDDDHEHGHSSGGDKGHEHAGGDAR